MPQAGRPLVFCEPSCLSAVREDAPALLRGEARRKAEVVAEASVLFEEFVAPRAHATALRARARRRILLHGHCHQKSMAPASRRAKALLVAHSRATVVDLDAGCCGMAGSFGYAREHYDVSRAIGERKLFPAVRAASPTARSSSRPARRAVIRSHDFTGDGRRASGGAARSTARTT